jgi:hypothetical protein
MIIAMLTNYKIFILVYVIFSEETIFEIPVTIDFW